jgi:hypothetical protein
LLGAQCIVEHDETITPVGVDGSIIENRIHEAIVRTYPGAGAVNFKGFS